MAGSGAVCAGLVARGVTPSTPAPSPTAGPDLDRLIREELEKAMRRK